MNEKLMMILEELSKSEVMIKKLAEINEKFPDKKENAEALAELAKENNIDISAADILNETEKVHSDELSEEELEQISGGTMIAHLNNSDAYQTDCYCVAGGGGKSDSLQKTCACVFAGAGELTNAGKSKFNNNDAVMFCALVGESAHIFYEDKNPWW